MNAARRLETAVLVSGQEDFAGLKLREDPLSRMGASRRAEFPDDLRSAVGPSCLPNRRAHGFPSASQLFHSACRPSKSFSFSEKAEDRIRQAHEAALASRHLADGRRLSRGVTTGAFESGRWAKAADRTGMAPRPFLRGPLGQGGDP